MKAKKQEVVENTFTLDLSNIGAMAKKGKPKATKETKVPKTRLLKESEKGNRGGAKKNSPVKPLPKPEQKVKLKQIANATAQYKHLRLMVSQDLINEFDALFKRFVEQTQTYWVNTSRIHVFTLGVLYLEQKHTKANTYLQATDDFVAFVSRRGNRPKSAETALRKGNAESLFFKAEPKIINGYYNLLYSFLVANDDTENLSYSASYFFKDFLDQLQGSFKTFCSYGKKQR